MTATQQPLGSGFGARSTASQVLDGIDLAGRTALVTGGYSGIGLETTRALSAAGASVVVPARRPDTAREALAGIDRVTVDELDLGDLGSVDAFAQRALGAHASIDIVIGSAGIMAVPERGLLGDGWEAQFATNHLGHFALVNRLWPAIESAGGRVVAVSSTAHHRTGIRWDDVDFATGYDKWEAYGQSKTANALFAVHLDALARDRGVRAFAVHPGGILTQLQRHMTTQEQVDMGWIDADGNLVNPVFKSTEQGAATQTWAATSPQLDGLGGLYLEDCDVARPWVEGGPRAGVRPWAVDPDEAARLWTLSAERTGVDAFA